MSDESHVRTFARWPLLLAAVTLASAGIGLDLAAQAPVAYGLWALASACLGAFLYAEGARHREWLDVNGATPRRSLDVPSTHDDDVRGSAV